MSSNYQGTPANVTVGLSATISGATNASPIVITTSAAHNYATGDTVAVNGVGGNTSANGLWTITVVSSTTYSLNGSTGSGAYTSGGTSTDQFQTPYGQIPSDGDAFTAASVGAMLQLLCDRTQALTLNARLRVVTFGGISSGTWTVPASCRMALAFGYGGGGGGGGGATGQVAINSPACGGGGGGGALLKIMPFAVTPGETLNINIGSGGSGAGVGGHVANIGDNGFAGGATTIDRAGTYLVTFAGAGGGAGGGQYITGASVSQYFAAPGGPPLCGTGTQSAFQLGNAYNVGMLVSTASTAGAFAIDFPLLTATGGNGITNLISGAGNPGCRGGSNDKGFYGGTGLGPFLGGAGGTNGTNSGSTLGGGAGGGGGAGPNGQGGAGGNGGNAGATGAAGGLGGSVSSNTGAGGGGGGGGGCGTGASGAGGSGNNGGSGMLYIAYFSLT